MTTQAARIFAIVATSAWLGATLFFSTVVAPAAFRVLPERVLAGALVGRTLPVIFWSGILVGALVAWFARPEFLAGRRTVTLTAGLALAVLCAVAQLGVTPRIERLRHEIGTSLDSLPADDARRAAFGSLHGLSVALFGGAMIAAGVVLAAQLRDSASA
jgi:hypothetical protein